MTGYTDETGTFSHNMDLSKRRAESLKNIIMGKGVAEDRIVTYGKGIYSEKPEGDRKYARKVSFILFR